MVIKRIYKAGNTTNVVTVPIDEMRAKGLKTGDYVDCTFRKIDKKANEKIREIETEDEIKEEELFEFKEEIKK